MKHIIQKDDTGCGIACIAMIAGTTYKKIKVQFIKHKEAKKKNVKGEFYTKIGELADLAEMYNITLSRRITKFKDWDSIPDKAILKINYQKATKPRYECWHWVVYRNTAKERYVLDPATTNPKRKDLKRIEKNIIGFYKVTE